MADKVKGEVVLKSPIALHSVEDSVMRIDVMSLVAIANGVVGVAMEVDASVSFVIKGTCSNPIHVDGNDHVKTVEACTVEGEVMLKL